MRLLLTSAGIKNASIHSALVELLGRSTEEATALCIPTGSYGHHNFAGAWRFINGTSPTPMVELGWKSLGVLELTALPSLERERWVPRWASLFADTGCSKNKYVAEPMCERIGSVSAAFQKSFANATVKSIEHKGMDEVGPPAGSIYVAAVTFSNGVVVVFGGGRPEAVPPDESCPGDGSGCVWKVEGPDQNRRFLEAAMG